MSIICDSTLAEGRPELLRVNNLLIDYLSLLMGLLSN
jgi:hypothetical protein